MVDSIWISRLRTAYSRWIRPIFPRIRPGTHAGIPTSHQWKRLIDYLLPVVETDDAWEAGVVGAHRRLTRSGDSVLIVGGGWGISLVAASEQTGPRGQVMVYEASRAQISRLQETAELNSIDGYSVRHVRVTEGSRIWNHDPGTDDDAQMASPDELPKVDVLELDCEGAEFPILEELTIRPRVIIVEVHSDATTEPATRILTLLEARGYEIVYRSGHDGILLSHSEACHLLQVEQGTRCANGARSPVVLGAVRRSATVASDA